MVDQLINIISREAVVFESFLESLEQQKQMLVNNDVDGLNRVTRFQRDRIAESQELTRQREALVRRIKEEMNIEGDLNVTRLIGLVDKTQADQLSRLSTVIFALNEKITESRNQNVMLLNRSREYISRMMQMLSKAQQPDTYSHGTTRPQQAATVAVDRRA
jgi:hypothetical protein